MSEETQDSLAAAMSELSESDAAEAAEASETSSSAPTGGPATLQPPNQGPPKLLMLQKPPKPPKKPTRMANTRYGCGDIFAN